MIGFKEDGRTQDGGSSGREVSELSCEAVDELAGAYALGAMPDEERLAVERHLESCPETHRELRDLVETAALLAYGCEEEAPSPLLRERLLAAAQRDLEPPAPLETPPQAPVSIRTPARNPARAQRRWFSTPALGGLAAVLAVLAIGLGVWSASQQSTIQQKDARLVSQQRVLTALAAGAAAMPMPATGALPAGLLIQPAGNQPALLVVDVPPATSGKTYQAWFIVAGHPQSAGLFDGSSSGPVVIQLNGSISRAQAVAVTIEPRGGSSAPTSAPVMQRALS